MLIFVIPNQVNVKTCFKSVTSQSSLDDVILTNWPRSFQKTAVISAGLSDYHKMKKQSPRRVL